MIECIRTEFALCAAPLDTILVEIACEECRHHKAVLAAETVGRRYEAAARTVESKDLTLVRRHEAETWASLALVNVTTFSAIGKQEFKVVHPAA